MCTKKTKRTKFALVLFLSMILGIGCFNKPAEATSNGSLPFLKVEGQYIVNDRGEKVFLRGINFGNWLLWEGGSLGIINYAEHKLRNLTEERIDKNKVDLFFELIKKYHTTKEDFYAAKNEGLNIIRLGFHHRYVRNEPTELDQAVQWAKEAGIYVILNLHAAPGSQAPAYFADSDGTAHLWEKREYQEELMRLWEILAERYKNEPVVAGYEILNEPETSNGWKVTELYQKTVERIRKIDKKHIIFLDGNHYAGDPSVLDPPFDDNVVYVFHHYEESVVDMQQWVETEGWLAFRNKYNVPLMCNEFHFYGGAEKYLEEEGIHWAPWIHQKLSSEWHEWIDSIRSKNREKLIEQRKQILRMVESSSLSEECKEEVMETLSGLHPGGIGISFRRYAQKYQGDRRELRRLLKELNETIDTSWIEIFSDTINKMSAAELEELTRNMRDRSGRQFTSDESNY